MLNATSKLIHYHGWMIDLVREEQDFVFLCYPPEYPDYCNDGMTYSRLDAALQMAYQFIDREIAIQALLDVVEDWLEGGQIDVDEYWNLTNFE